MEKVWIDPYGRTVPLLHQKPVNYSQGGVIKWEANQYDPFKNDLQRDNKPVLLEYGCMVIPKPSMQLFYEFERLYGSVKQPKVTDRKKLVEVIVMPEEAIIPPKHVPAMKAFLAKHGVQLPLKKYNLFERKIKKPYL